MVYYSGTIGFTTGRIALTFLGGMFFWTFFEYLAHRFLFHMIANSGRANRFIYTLHGNHHHYPRDKQRLFMPPVPSLILSSAIFGLMYLILGSKAFMFFPGFLLGYLMYGTMHLSLIHI